jgi:hypothetical protein
MATMSFGVRLAEYDRAVASKRIPFCVVKTLLGVSRTVVHQRVATKGGKGRLLLQRQTYPDGE